MSAEQMVRKLDSLRAETDKYESYLRALRLGRGIEMIRFRFRFRAGVYGFGWLNEKTPETMPAGMEREFYLFLAEKAASAARAACDAEKAMEGLR